MELKDVKPGTLLRVALGSYDPWPSVVMPYEWVPAKVLKEKKLKLNEFFVYFIADDTYSRTFVNKAKPLSYDILIKEYFDEKRNFKALRGKKKYSEEGQAAYRHLLDLLENNDHDEAIKQIFLESNVIDNTDFDLATLGTPFLSSDLSEPVKGRALKKKRTNTEINKEEETINNTPVKKSKKDEKEEYTEEAKIAQVQSFRFKLQRGLLQRSEPPSSKDLHDCYEVLKELQDFNKYITIDLLKVSKLHKVLRAILKVDNLKNPEGLEFHEISVALLIDWKDYIHEIRIEKDKQGTETPSSSIIDNKTKISNDETSAEGNENGDKVKAANGNSELKLETNDEAVSTETNGDSKV